MSWKLSINVKELYNQFPERFDDINVVAIPLEIHLKFFASRDTEKHRALILEYYRTYENMITNKMEVIL